MTFSAIQGLLETLLWPANQIQHLPDLVRQLVKSGLLNTNTTFAVLDHNTD